MIMIDHPVEFYLLTLVRQDGRRKIIITSDKPPEDVLRKRKTEVNNFTCFKSVGNRALTLKLISIFGQNNN